MPLPFLLIGIAAASGLFGAKKTIDASRDNSNAKENNALANQIFDEARETLESKKAATTRALEELGLLKLRVWERDLGCFIELFGRLKNVELEGNIGQNRLPPMDSASLVEMREVSFSASEVLGGGVAAIGSGALVGVAAYGGATMLAAASTGTAISTLSGVAATNATLAWFGGGALSAGGLGMAGGMAVLGGLVAGPALLVTGFMLSAKAKEKLASSRSNLIQAKDAASQMDQAGVALDGINEMATLIGTQIEGFQGFFRNQIYQLLDVILQHGIDYADFPVEARQVVQRVVLSTQVLKGLVEVPLLTQEGELEPSLSFTLRSLQSSARQLGIGGNA